MSFSCSPPAPRPLLVPQLVQVGNLTAGSNNWSKRSGIGRSQPSELNLVDFGPLGLIFGELVVSGVVSDITWQNGVFLSFTLFLREFSKIDGKLVENCQFSRNFPLFPENLDFLLPKARASLRDGWRSFRVENK